MTAYALRLENATDTAARVRIGDLLGLAPDGALTARTGIRPASGAGDVAQVDGTMQVTVEPFAAWVQGGISTAQGGYPFVLDAQATLMLSNGDATLDRVDTIAAVVHDDPYDGSGLVDAAVVVIEGTPGSGAPTLPDNCLPLRDIDVPAGLSTGTGGMAGSNLSTDRRTWLDGLSGPPAGSVMPFAGSAEPIGWFIADGRTVSRTSYDRLFAAIGTAYGAGDGSTTFNLPNLKGRVPVGLDTGQAEFDALGESGGEKTHTLSEAELAPHDHGQTVTIDLGTPAGGMRNTVVGGGAVWTASDDVQIQDAGGGAAHNNLQPYVVLNYLIKY